MKVRSCLSVGDWKKSVEVEFENEWNANLDSISSMINDIMSNHKSYKTKKSKNVEIQISVDSTELEEAIQNALNYVCGDDK